MDGITHLIKSMTEIFGEFLDTCMFNRSMTHSWLITSSLTPMSKSGYSQGLTVFQEFSKSIETVKLIKTKILKKTYTVVADFTIRSPQSLILVAYIT